MPALEDQLPADLPVLPIERFLRTAVDSMNFEKKRRG